MGRGSGERVRRASPGCASGSAELLWLGSSARAMVFCSSGFPCARWFCSSGSSVLRRFRCSRFSSARAMVFVARAFRACDGFVARAFRPATISLLAFFFRPRDGFCGSGFPCVRWFCSSGLPVGAARTAPESATGDPRGFAFAVSVLRFAIAKISGQGKGRSTSKDKGKSSGRGNGRSNGKSKSKGNGKGLRSRPGCAGPKT